MKGITLRLWRRHYRFTRLAHPPTSLFPTSTLGGCVNHELRPRVFYSNPAAGSGVCWALNSATAALI